MFIARKAAQNPAPIASPHQLSQVAPSSATLRAMVLNLGSVHTGVFNIADVAIMVGAGMLLYVEWRKKSEA
jgi:hypothetical protein